MKNWTYFLFFTLMILACGDPSPQWTLSEKIYTTDVRPTGVALVNSEWTVSSRQDNMIVTVSRDGNVRSHNTQFTSPCRLMARGPQLIVPEFDNNRVATLVGNEIMYYPLVSQPDGVMAADIIKGRVAVADYNQHRIIYYKGGEDLTFGEEGAQVGQFRYPTDLQFYQGQLYVADNQNSRIQQFDQEGKYVRSIGSANDMDQASGVFVWEQGIMVCDKKGGQVLFYSHEGELIHTIQEGFERPSDAFGVGNVIYVADEGGGYVGILERR